MPPVQRSSLPLPLRLLLLLLCYPFPLLHPLHLLRLGLLVRVAHPLPQRLVDTTKRASTKVSCGRRFGESSDTCLWTRAVVRRGLASMTHHPKLGFKRQGFQCCGFQCCRVLLNEGLFQSAFE